MGTNDDLVTVGRTLNQQISQLIQTFQNAFPVGGANAKLKAYTVASAPSASAEGAGTMIYVSNGAAGSPVAAFSDGTDWLRVDTLAAISA
jgi:hypothetical protein